jgi:pyruvate dehydrogenase E1 component alpha subunit
MSDAISLSGATEGNAMAKPAVKPKVESLPVKSKLPPKSSGPGDNSASAEELKSYYRDMLLIRRFEERAGQLYGMGLIGGFCHLYIGQEAVVVGMQANVRDKDAVITPIATMAICWPAAWTPRE